MLLTNGNLMTEPNANTLVTDFRYLMAFDPYSALYLPIVASLEDL